ncbi:MAG: hypothetical protein FWF61_06025 [Brevinematales bacterium]|nr:hypothetical protein [Brevinematales bacterium]
MRYFAQRIKSTKMNTPSVSTAAEISNMPTEQDLIRAGALLARERNFKDLVNVFVEQAQDISHVDLALFTF